VARYRDWSSEVFWCGTLFSTLLVLGVSDTHLDEEGSWCKSSATPVAVIRNEEQATGHWRICAGKALSPHLTFKPEDLPKRNAVIVATMPHAATSICLSAGKIGFV